MSKTGYKPESFEVIDDMLQFCDGVYEVDKLTKILAHYQLQGKLFENKNDFENERDKLKYKIKEVIRSLIFGGKLKKIITLRTVDYYDIDDCVGGIPSRKNISVANISLSEFADWVRKHPDFKCPEIILKMAPNAAVEVVASEKDKPSNVGGRHKSYITEAIEFTYNKYLKEGNTEILRENNVREFVNRLKELANEEGNANFIKYVADRIETVKITPSGCTIKTKDNYHQASNSREIKDNGRTYTLSRVSQILVTLRHKYPLPM